MGVVTSRQSPTIPGGDDFLLKGGHLRQAAFPFASWPMQDVKMLLSTLKKVGTFVMVQSQFNAWISSAVPAITNEEAQELFRLMDTGNNGRVNCLEFLAGIMMLSCEDFAAKTQFCFELYDLNLNGALCYEELVLMVRSTVLGTLRLIQLSEIRSLELLADDKPFEDIAGLALRVYDHSMNRSLSYEEFVSWARGNREIMRFVDEFAIFAQAAAKEPLYHHSGPGPHEGDEALPGSFPEDEDGEKYFSVASAKDMLPKEIPSESSRTSMRLDLAWTYAYSPRKGSKGTAKYLDAKRTRIGYATGTAVIVQDVHACTQTVYTGHRAPINSLDVHPSFQHIASADLSGEIRVWEPHRIENDDYQESAIQVAPGPSQILFSRSGQLLAVATNVAPKKLHSFDSRAPQRPRIEVWDWRTGERIGDPVEIPHGSIADIAWSADEDCLGAVGSTFAQLWMIQKAGPPAQRFRQHRSHRLAHDANEATGHLRGPSVPPGSCGSLEPVALDLESICKQQDLQPSSLCFVGKDLVIGTAQGMLVQYNISARRLEKVVDASMDSQPILHVIEWKAGIVSASALGELRLWDMGLHPLGTGLETVGSAGASTSFRSEEKLARNAITLAGSTSANEPISDSSIVVSSMCIVNPVLSKVALIATTSGHIFEINLGEKVSGPHRTKIPIVQALGNGAAPALAVMPQDDSIVVSCSCADASLCVWDSAARCLAYSCLLSSPGVCLAFAPNGEYLAVGLASGEISVRLAGSASLLSEEAARIPRSGLDCSGGPVSICFSPDGLRIAAYFSGGAVHVFDVRRHSLDQHKLFTRAQVLRIDAPSAEVPHRAVLGWSHCSSFLKISIFSVNEAMSLRHHYADIARGGHMLEDSLADVRGISWTSHAYPAEEDLQALPNSLRRDACVFDVALGRLAIGDQNGGSSCVNFPCASETTILRASPADSERVPVVCVKFIQGGAAIMAAYANGTMAQWAVVENDSNIDDEEKEAKQEVASICDLEFEHEIAQRRLVASSDDSCEEVSVQNASSIPEFDRLCEGDETMPLNDWQSSQEAPDAQKSDEHQVLLDAMGVHEGHKDAEVVLDWVQGYNAAGKNIQYLFDRRLAFPACGMVTMVGFNTGSGKLQQRFLRPQHAASLQYREIPAGRRVVEVLATTPRRTHIAFAQGSSVHVWDAETMLMVCEIDLPWAKGGVSHLAFSSDGNLLCVVGADHMQTVATVEWSTRRVQGFVPSGADSVHDMIWTCEKHFVTVGVRHVTFWKSRRGSAPTSQRGSFASKTGVTVAVQNVYSVCAVDSSTAITGLADGTLAVWDVKAHCITKILNQHQERAGPCFALCFVPTQMGGFLAGNKAGHVTLWTRAGPDDFEEHVLHKAEEKSKGVGVRAISVISKDQNAQRIAGSNASRLVYGAVAFRDGKITEFIIDTDACSLAHDTAPELLLETHSKGEAWALATHPKEQLAVSAADDGKLCLWALDEKKKVAEVEVQRKVISLALSSAEAQGSLGHLAVATDDGSLQIFALFLPPSSTERSLEEMSVEPFSDIDALRDWAQVLRYSPDASLLAAGCHDQSIYIFDRSANYVLLHKLAGHTSFVANLDWSLESIQGEMGLPLWHLQSICGSKELLYWQVSRNAAQRLSSAGFAKDIEWASWTCTNGWAVSKVPTRAHWTTCARSNGGLHLIAGDKDGNLNLHSFPCAASGRVYKDHAAQVTQVCFSAQDRYVLSLDSRRALCIWQTENLEAICRAREIWAQRSEAEKNHLLDQARQRLAGRRDGSQQPNYIEAAAYSRQQFPTKHALAQEEADLPWSIDNVAWKDRLPKRALASASPLARPADLELDWVYGRSSRCGARFVGEQDDVLFVAANLAVIQRPVRDGRLARQSFFWGHDSAIVAVDVSTDGQLIATGDDAGHVMIWKEATLQQECSLRVEGGVQQVALSALGSLVAVLTYAGAFTIACAKTGQIKATGGSGPARAMVLVPKSEGDTNADIDVILADETGLRVWTFDPVRNRMSSAAARSPVEGQITCLAFLGGRLVSGHADGALVAWNGVSTSVWRIMTKEDLKKPHSRIVLADLATIMPGRDRRELLCFSSSGKAVFVDTNLDPLPGDGLEALGVALAHGDCDRTGRGAWLLSTQQGRLLEYETFSHNLSELVCGHGFAHQGLECAAFSIDGQPHMVTAGTDARICMWDLRERKLVREQALPDAATSCAVSVSGHHHIAVGTRSGVLVIFAANLTRQLLQVSIAFLQGSDHSRDAVRSLQYSGDGQRLAVGSDDGQIRILETRNYALVQKLSLEPPNPVTHLDWSCDGTRIRSNGCVQSLSTLQVARLVPKLKQNVYHEMQVKDEAGSLAPHGRDPMWSTSTCALTEKTAKLCSSESSRVPVAVAEDCGVVAMSDGRLEGISGGAASRVRLAAKNGGQLFAKRDERWLVSSGRMDGLVFQFITN